MIAHRRAADGDQPAPLDSRRARSPGLTRGRRTRSSGSRPSPPPENNFDVIPRVRSVEPMKDIRRQIEQQTGVPQQYRSGEPLLAAMSGARRTDHRAVEVGGVRQVVADYVTLTKPRVQLLLLLTTVTTMYVAGDPSVGLVALDLPRRLPVGGRRRRGQPLLRPRHRRPDGPHGHAAGARRAASAPARRSPTGSCCRRCRSCCSRRRSTCWPPCSRCAGFLGYVLVYTMWLKRSTPQNIVIGGAAGAVPPLVGWAAVTGHVDPAAWYLFAIVFYWTPPHFWALSLLMKDEYARVGVPMMPVVHGETETRRQIVLYTCLLVVLTMLPVVFGFFGAIYARRGAVARGVVPGARRPAPAPRRPPERAAHLPLLAGLPGRAVRRDGRRRALVDCRAMDRRLARRNLRTAMIAAIIGLLMFALTFVAAAALPVMSELEHRGDPARRRGDPHAGAEPDPDRSTPRRWRSRSSRSRSPGTSSRSAGSSSS